VSQSGADSLRAVLDSVFAAPGYQWIERHDPLSFITTRIIAFRQWLFDLQTTHPALYQAMLAVMLSVVVGVFVHAAWVFLRTLRSGRESRQAGESRAAGSRRDREWFLGQAQLLAGEGRFAEALQHEFLALVLALDGRSLLRFHPSKTPAEYGREARLAPDATIEFRALIGALYGFAFGGRPCGPEEFAAWRARTAPERYAPAH